MKLCIPALLLAAAVSALPVSAAHAYALSTASVSNIRFTLTDLNLTDGIAPSLALAQEDGSFFTSLVDVQYFTSRNGTTHQQRQLLTTPWQDRSAQLKLDNAGLPSGVQLETRAQITGAALDALAMRADAVNNDANGFSWAYGQTVWGGALRLSPYTALVLSFDLAVQATLPSANAPGAAESWAWASIDDENYALSHALGADRYEDAVGAAATRTFTYSRASGADARDIYALFVAGVSTFSDTPVPEPETYTLLLAGLGLLGASRYRTRRTGSGIPAA